MSRSDSLLVVLVYVLVALLLTRPLAGDFAWRMYDSGKRAQVKPLPSQWIGAGVMAFGLMLLWPLALIGVACWRLGGKRAIGREREEQVRARDHRIAELEEELNIR